MPERDGAAEESEERVVPVGAEAESTSDAAGSPDRAIDRSVLPEDERELLDAFDRLAPAGTVHWAFDDAMRRLSTPGERATWIEPWYGLPADLWDRGRGAKAGERLLGDVIKLVAQELTEYSQRIVDDVRRSTPEETSVFDALHYLAARVERLETAADPLGIRPAELDLPSPDAGEWEQDMPAWLGDPRGLPVLIGEMGVHPVLDAVVAAGTEVDAVDPRGAVVWALDEASPGRPGQVHVTLAEVTEHLHRLPAADRSGIVLSGCVDRATLAGKVELMDAALRVLAPGGTLVVLAVDQAAWDASVAPTVRDLLPGRPLHPDTWALIMARRGFPVHEVHRAKSGSVHAVVARTDR